MSDLSQLFPDIPAEILRDYESSQQQFNANAPISVGGEYSTVTDDQIYSYLEQAGRIRAPLRPLNSGGMNPDGSQAQPYQGPPQFRGAGFGEQFSHSGNPPLPTGQATVEAADYGNGQVGQQQQFIAPPPSWGEVPPAQQPPTQQFPQQPPAQPSPIPPTPGVVPPPPAPPAPTPYTPPTQQAPPALPTQTPAPSLPPSPGADTRQQGMEQLVSLWDNDPNLRNLVASYLTTGRIAGQPPAGTLPPQAAPTQPTQPQLQPTQQYAPPAVLPQLPPLDEYADPTLRALAQQNQLLVSAVQSLAQGQQDIRDSQQQAQAADFERQTREMSTVVESVASNFASTYQLPPNVMQEIRSIAGRMGAAVTYMNGTHPVTGIPVRPDYAEAAKTAFEIAYHASPLAQQIEQQRVIQRAVVDNDRKRRLGGIGGSSASVSRTPPAPTDAAGRREAMNREVEQMMRGEWTG